MREPATYAEIQDFLRFRVGETELGFATVHGFYAEQHRTLEAMLIAEPNQQIAGALGSLDRCEGSLIVREDRDLTDEWHGSIERTSPRADALAGFRTADYQVAVDLSPASFDRFLALLQTGQRLFGLSIGFQNIDGPVQEPGRMKPDQWDDITYPHVTLTSFFLRWAPPGQVGLPTYAWPAAAP